MVNNLTGGLLLKQRSTLRSPPAAPGPKPRVESRSRSSCPSSRWKTSQKIQISGYLTITGGRWSKGRQVGRRRRWGRELFVLRADKLEDGGVGIRQILHPFGQIGLLTGPSGFRLPRICCPRKRHSGRLHTLFLDMPCMKKVYRDK